MSSSSIAAANEKVSKLTCEDQEGNQCPKCGPYKKLSREVKLLNELRAAEHGVAATICFFASQGFPDLKESSVRTWKKAYILEVRTRLRDSEGSDVHVTVKALTEKMGRPYILGEELDKQVRAYMHLTALRNQGGIVNTAIAISCVEGAVQNKDSNLLACNGSHIVLSKYWAKNLLN